MRTHHRRSVNNPFANRSHRTVGYSDHRYGNAHHHNQQNRGRKGCLRSPLTCFVMLLGCISFLILPSSNLDDQPLLNNINPDREKPTEPQSLPKESKEFELRNDDTATDRSIEKSSSFSQNYSGDEALDQKTKKGNNEINVIENVDVEEYNFLYDRNNHLMEGEYNDDGVIGIDFNLVGKSETHEVFNIDESQINEKSREDHEKDLREQDSNSFVDVFNLGESEPHERYENKKFETNIKSKGNDMKSDDAIYQSTIEPKNEINISYEEGRPTDKIEFGSFEVLTMKDMDSLVDLNETEFDEGIEMEEIEDEIGDLDEKREIGKEESVNEVSVEDAVRIFSNLDESYGMQGKNLTHNTSGNFAGGDPLTNVSNTSGTLIPIPPNLNQTLSNELLYANNSATLSDESTDGIVTNRNVTMSTNLSNLTDVEHTNFTEEGSKFRNEDEFKSLSNTKGAEIISANEAMTELMFMNETGKGSNSSSRGNSEKITDEAKSSPTVIEIIVTNETIDENLITYGKSEVSGEAIFADNATSSSNTSFTEIFVKNEPFNENLITNGNSEVTGVSIHGDQAISSSSTSFTEINIKNETVDENLTTNGNSEVTGESIHAESLSNTSFAEIIIKNETVDENMTTKGNSEVTGETIEATIQSVASSSNTSTTARVFDVGSTSTNFGDVARIDVKRPKTSHVDTFDTVIGDSDSLAITSNNTESVTIKSSSFSAESVELEDIAKATTTTTNESGLNRTGNLRGFIAG